MEYKDRLERSKNIAMKISMWLFVGFIGLYPLFIGLSIYFTHRTMYNVFVFIVILWSFLMQTLLGFSLGYFDSVVHFWIKKSRKH